MQYLSSNTKGTPRGISVCSGYKHGPWGSELFPGRLSTFRSDVVSRDVKFQDLRSKSNHVLTITGRRAPFASHYPPSPLASEIWPASGCLAMRISGLQVVPWRRSSHQHQARGSPGSPPRSVKRFKGQKLDNLKAESHTIPCTKCFQLPFV